MNSIPMSQSMSTELHLETPTGNLLSSLDEATRAEVLERHFIERPLVLATKPFARMIQIELEKVSYFDMRLTRFIRTKTTLGAHKLGPMGWFNAYGYVCVSIKQNTFMHSHLTCLWFTGSLPPSKTEIDHIDGNILNDRPDNLRVVSNSINHRNMKMKRNNTTGYTGVYYDKRRGNYESYVVINWKKHHIGMHATALEAHYAREAYITARPELGFTIRHGK